MGEILKTKEEKNLLKEYGEGKIIRSQNIFVPEKGIGEVELRRFPALYRVLTENGGRTRQGFHLFAFGAYKKSFDWLLGGLSAEAARQRLGPDFHLEVKVSCFLNCALASISDESNLPYIGRFKNAIDELSIEYHKMQQAKGSELFQSISSYLTYVTYIEQYSPSATFYDGPAGSISEAFRVGNALKTLERIKGTGFTHLNSIKSPIFDLFDGAAIQKSLKGNSSDICLFSFLIMQLYRIVIPLISDKREFHVFENTFGIEGFITHVFQLPQDPMTIAKIKNAFKIIKEMKTYVKDQPFKDLPGMISTIMRLINMYG